MMWLGRFLRTQLKRLLTKERYVALESKIPSLGSRFQDIDEFGLYLHIPFCRQICPYCPYNKEIYHPEVAESYTNAVKKEIDIYSDLIGNRPVTSFYIGVCGRCHCEQSEAISPLHLEIASLRQAQDRRRKKRSSQ